MTIPPIDPREPLLDEATVNTEILRGVHQLESLEARQVSEAEERLRAATKEPLFSKKVMLAWAVAALAVWGAFSFAVPRFAEVVRMATRSHTEAPATNSQTVIETKGGTIVITRTETGVTINRRGPDAESTEPVPGATQAPLPDAPVVPPSAEAPAAPAAPAAPQPTGKK